VIVVDEMSMVDVILMYRLLRHLPSGIRLVLVGDPSQLPPIGPGLVLHALAQLPSVPQVELKVVKRQSAITGIPKIASLIRYHQAPEWAHYLGKPDTGVFFLPCNSTNLEEVTLRVYAEVGGSGSDYNVQILSITNGNIGGVNNLNAKLHNRYQQKSKHVLYQDREFGLVGASTLNRVAIKVGDLVMYTENDYGLGLRNGSLGRVIEALPVDKPEAPCCRCEFEGIEYCLTTENVQLLTHAYAITVHKSQGSQFTRVIVPIRWSRLLDQTLIYTAVTRGVEQVVLIGNEQVLNNAIRAPASATQRHIVLPELLNA
jgi:exodeoxyribonuclease V alpha subunit